MTKISAKTVKLVEARLGKGESLRSIAADLGVTHQSLQYHRRRAGRPALKATTRAGQEHHSWRGGSYTDRYGYRMVLAPGRGKSSRYVPEHVLVAESQLGRELRRDEVVHHVDGNKANNQPGNLHVCTRQEHRELHSQLERLALGLLGEAVHWTGRGYKLR